MNDYLVKISGRGMTTDRDVVRADQLASSQTSCRCSVELFGDVGQEQNVGSGHSNGIDDSPIGADFSLVADIRVEVALKQRRQIAIVAVPE